MSGAGSRRKGIKGEGEVVALAKAHGIRAQRTAALQAGIYGAGADVALAIPGIHLEVKMQGRIQIVEWMRQAERDAQDGETPVVAWRLCRRGTSTGWYATQPLSAWLDLAKTRP